MGITIVVGGQYGGEGKGKVSYYFAKENNIKIAVRVGGANSGHTVVNDNNEKIILRQLPTPAIIPDTVAVLAAGSYIDLDVLRHEINITGLTRDRLLIDQNAMVITDEDKLNEANSSLRNDIGSTLSGTGNSVVRRIQRHSDQRLAKDVEELQPYIVDTKKYLYEELRGNQDVLIEGTQGYGLSLLHSPYYPFTTSRDTTAAGLLSEVGLSPFDVDEIILTIRAFPIRVEGNSGPLINEISWQELEHQPELSSVTRKIRRIANFDMEIVQKAILSNRPTKIVLNHLDYVLENERSGFMKNIECLIDQKIDYYGIDDRWLMKN